MVVILVTLPNWLPRGGGGGNPGILVMGRVKGLFLVQN